MKRLVTLFAIAIFGSFILNSCTRTEYVDNTTDNDTYSQMRDVTGTFTSSGNYAIDQGISIPSTDVVLVYRNINSNTTSAAIWQLLPKTYYLTSNRELDYNFIFNTTNVEIYTEANFDQATMSTAEKAMYLTNQTFRIVLVPASKAKNASVNFEDYNAVVKFYNLKEPK